MLSLLLAAAGLAAPAPPPARPTVETIVLLRHGEKPLLGYGQLSCRGLNRALALPDVLIGRFGRPAAIFAPDPSGPTDDPAGRFDYVRPLATIEPTAIRLGLPVEARIGFRDIAALQARLAQPRLAAATVFVAWEHGVAEELTRRILAANGGDARAVPHWGGGDYDSLYVVRIRRSAVAPRANFAREREGLNGLTDACPGRGR